MEAHVRQLQKQYCWTTCSKFFIPDAKCLLFR